MRTSLTRLGLLLLATTALGCAPTGRAPRPKESLPPAERILAVEAAGPSAVAEAQADLVRLLRDRCPVIRAQAAQVLAEAAAQGDPNLVRPALKHPDALVRAVAQAAYIEASPYGRAPVVVKGAVEEVRPAVLDALARLRDPAGRVDLAAAVRARLDLLRSALEGEPARAVLAADLLARVGDAAALRRLPRLIDTVDGPALAKAIRASVRDDLMIAPTVLPKAFERGTAARRAVMRALVAAPDPRLASLMRRGLADADEAVRRNAVRALGNLGAAAPVADLARVLERGDETAADVLAALGAIGRPAADVLRQYAKALAAKGAPAREALEVRALMALAPWANRDDIPWVAERLKSPSPYIRAAAATVLGRTAHPAAQAALVPLVKDPSPLVRAAAAKALGQIGTIYAANHLLDLLKDQEPLVASMAAWGLGASGWTDAVPALVKVIEAGPGKAAKGPVRVGDMFARPDLAAAEALGHIRSPEAVKALRTALEAKDWRLRAAAAEALRAAADRSAETLEALQKRIADDPVSVVRGQALVALEALGGTYEPRV